MDLFYFYILSLSVIFIFCDFLSNFCSSLTFADQIKFCDFFSFFPFPVFPDLCEPWNNIINMDILQQQSFSRLVQWCQNVYKNIAHRGSPSKCSKKQWHRIKQL